MSFNWDRIGTFGTTTEAETWCDRQNVDPRDRELIPSGQGVELRFAKARSKMSAPTAGAGRRARRIVSGRCPDQGNGAVSLLTLYLGSQAKCQP